MRSGTPTYQARSQLIEDSLVTDSMGESPSRESVERLGRLEKGNEQHSCPT